MSDTEKREKTSWREQFYKEYLTKDPTAFGNALRLKRENLPTRLFRYRGWNEYTLEEIRTGTIYLSPPDQFNDIFDSWVGCNWSDLIEASKEEVGKNFRKRYPNSNELQRIMASDNWYRTLIYDSARKEGTEPDRIYNALIAAIDRSSELMEDKLNEVIRRMVRIACFTTKPDNMPLWYHYAKDTGSGLARTGPGSSGAYAGVCLEYEINHESVDPFIINSTFPVNYQSEMPDMITLVKEYPFQILKYVATLKNTDWSYEDEWRLILTLGDIYQSLENVPEHVWAEGVKYPFLPVKAVYMGDQMGLENRQKMKRLAGERGFRLYQMQAIRGRYRAEEVGTE